MSAEHGPAAQTVYAIVQGGTEEDLRRWSAQEVVARGTGGIAIGGSLGADKPQMYEVVDWTTSVLPEAPPRHLLGIGDVDDLIRGVELGIERDPEISDLIKRLQALTPQQTRVLGMLAEGLLNKQIAFELGVSEATIKAHVSAILQKLGVDSRTQAVIQLSKIGGDPLQPVS